MTLDAEIMFDQPDLTALLVKMDDATLDTLGFGVIGFDIEDRVRRYNTFESKAAGLGIERVLNQNLFTVVAPCMNNFLVAQRFADARETGMALDDTINYVLTLRMRPTKVKLRLLSDPMSELCYVLVQRI
ncbi:MAG: phosphonate transporter [Burkholderiaceae bacterium]|nr:phosphonate transporter [Burkholderiaceae bacterium]